MPQFVEVKTNVLDLYFIGKYLSVKHLCKPVYIQSARIIKRGKNKKEVSKTEEALSLTLLSCLLIK